MIENPYDYRSLSKMSAGHAYTGNRSITVYTREVGELKSLKVRLYHQSSGLLLSEILSDESGKAVFSGLKNIPEGYFVTCHDVDDPMQAGDVSDFLSVD